MEQALKVQPAMADAVASARVDLAALHRIADQRGWSEAIVNHMTMMVPGRSDQFFLIPYGLHWSEVRASDFLVLDLDGRTLSGHGEAEISAVSLHAPLHRRLPQARCVVHTHQPNISALTALKDQRLLMVHQDAMLFHGAVSYLDSYDDLPLDHGAGELCAEIMGDKLVLLMKNHGPMVVGETIARTFQTLYYLDRIANVQMKAFATGREVEVIADELAAKMSPFMRSHYLGAEAVMHFDAVKRILDRQGADYAS